MTSDQRERLRIVLMQGILVRQGECITVAVADERARNLTTIVELFFAELKPEVTWKGPAPTGETAEQHAERIIK